MRAAIAIVCLTLVGCGKAEDAREKQEFLHDALSYVSSTESIKKFGFMGDIHMDSLNTSLQITHATIARRAVAAMLAEGVTDLILLGDNMDDGHWCEAESVLAVVAPYDPHDPSHRLYGVAGNHDDDDARLIPIGKQWIPHEQIFETYLTQGFDFPSIGLRLLLWYSGFNALSGPESAAAQAWLDYQTKTTPTGWMVVIPQHYPAYSQIQRGGDQPVQLNWFVPQIAERYRVDLLLSAHSHGGPEVFRATQGSPLFLVSGGGGMELSVPDYDIVYSGFYENLWRDCTCQYFRHHYGTMEVSGEGISVVLKSVESPSGPGGQILYQCTIPRQYVDRDTL